MKRYEVTGIPLSPPVALFVDCKVGDVITADLVEDTEAELVGAGALSPLPEPKKAAEPKAESKS